MDAMHKMTHFVVRTSILFGSIAAFIGWLCFGGMVAISIGIGLGMGLLGYRLIVNLTQSLSIEDGKAQGQRGYVARYAMYGLILGICAWMHLSILGVLIGFLMHKASLLAYAQIEKEDHHGRAD